ncbi:MAG: hypothetical protein GY755_09010 [Chloroflexi bacterium]|nr:hypothetical protein [Chloroflexota bacterium]
MFALNLLSESTNEPNLSWLLWLVLAIFFVIVIVGWLVSKKKDDAPVAAPSMPETPAEPATPDVLKKLEGIGPKVEGVLNAAGITSFAQLAEADVEKLREVLAAAKLQMMDPSGWIEQAELAAKGDWDALEKLQDELKGGRRS